MKKALRTLLSVIVVALLLAACGGTTAQPSNRPPLKIAWSLWPGWYPMAIAQAQGLFEKHGVQVEATLYPVYTSQMPDYASGKLDGAFLAISDALQLAATNPDASRIVLVTDYSNGADVVVAAPEIQSVADLKGKRVGSLLGGFSELLMRNMLIQNGLSAADVTFVNVAPEEVPDQLSGDIEAAHTWEPFVSQAEQQGAHILFTSADAPGLISDMLLITDDVAQQRPEDVRAFVSAWFEAVAWWQANPTEGNAIIAQAVGLNPEEVSQDGIRLYNLQDNEHAFESSSDLTSIYTSAKIHVDFLASAGVITHAPDLQQLFDSSFLK